VLLLLCLQEDTVDNAVKTLEEKGIKQPVLLRVNGQYFIKADNTAIPLASCSCFVEAVEYLFMFFFVFDVAYPHELRVFLWIH